MLARTQDLTPLTHADIERLRTEYDRLPVHDPRRRLLAAYDQAQMDLRVMREIAVEERAERKRQSG